MSAELSRRLARVVHQPPIMQLSHRQRWALGIAAERAADFTELAPDHQRIILQAEATRERAIAQARLSAAG